MAKNGKAHRTTSIRIVHIVAILYKAILTFVQHAGNIFKGAYEAPHFNVHNYF